MLLHCTSHECVHVLLMLMLCTNACTLHISRMRARFTNAYALHQCYIMEWTNGRAFILHQQFTIHTYLFRPPLEIKKERYPAIPLFLPSRANPNRFFTKRTRSHARTCTRTRARRKRIFSPSPNTFRLIFIQRRRLLHFSLKLSLADRVGRFICRHRMGVGRHRHGVCRHRLGVCRRRTGRGDVAIRKGFYIKN